MIQRDAAVSYTHLDVYKRQGWNSVLGKKRIDTRKIVLKIWNEEIEEEQSVCYIYLQTRTSEDLDIYKPVSYTHLDVYKRQQL